ncbi:2OG-Fe(II) oxygenase [Sandarakinorhabdus rubra]|uniref:2OG-Fe(II) oxygenase n=1 Tax=Sandarakinorhabdus rubra TaxID=2672568 RepID=UPI0013DC3D0C|nr:2OG-Fe(II) oxygenase [Sandarakinorhabdus rubra]
MPIIETQILDRNSNAFRIDMARARDAGLALRAQYQAAQPFPHIVLDDFIDADLLRGLVAHWPEKPVKPGYNRDQERLKFEWQPVDLEAVQIRNFLAETISAPMVAFLEGLTGIEKLIVDPHFTGGGLHETRAGGHLGVHADFNIHSQMNVLRRINLLIYLNDDWDEGWNGALELWERDMSRCAHKVLPKLGRAVVFNTDLDSFHGVPDPVSCPPDRARRSVALYYYTAATDGLDAVPNRTTAFKPRPGSNDRTDWKIGFRHFLNDWLPPALYRMLRRKA